MKTGTEISEIRTTSAFRYVQKINSSKKYFNSCFNTSKKHILRYFTSLMCLNKLYLYVINLQLQLLDKNLFGLFHFSISVDIVFTVVVITGNLDSAFINKLRKKELHSVYYFIGK